jgi:hypothetical protein
MTLSLGVARFGDAFLPLAPAIRIKQTFVRPQFQQPDERCNNKRLSDIA